MKMTPEEKRVRHRERIRRTRLLNYKKQDVLAKLAQVYTPIEFIELPRLELEKLEPPIWMKQRIF